MQKIAAILLCFISCITAFADGIPVENGKITEPHKIVTLSESQMEELAILQSLTLSSEQWKELRSIYPACPKRFSSILPITWNDCTCGTEGIYAIQLSRNTVAVLTDTRPLNPVFENALEYGELLGLTIDHRGQFYYQGSLIRFSYLLEKISKSQGTMPPEEGKEPKQKRLWVSRPMGITRNDKVVKTRLDELFATAKKAGWETPDEQEETITLPQ